MANLTLEEMYADLESADAAGDDELAATIAAQIKRTQEYTASRQESAEGIREGQRSMARKTGSGIAEGLRRIPEGFMQLGTAIGEALGLADEGATEKRTTDIMSRRIAATGYDPDVEQAADITEVAGLSVPGVQIARGVGLLPKAAKITTLTGAVGRATAGGASIGALLQGASETAQDPQDVLWERSVGAGLGAGLPILPAIAFGVRTSAHNWIAELHRKAQTSKATLKERQNMLDVGALTLSQQGGNKVARSLETQVAATEAQNFYVDQFERTAKVFDTMIDDIASKQGVARRGMSSWEQAWRVSKAWKTNRASTIQAANNLYGKQMSHVLATANLDPSKWPIPFDNLQQTTAKMSTETGGPWFRLIRPGATKLSPELQMLDDYLGMVSGRNKALSAAGSGPEGISVEELVMMRRGLSNEDQSYWRAINSGSELTPQQKDSHRAVRDLMKAMDKDIDGFLAAEQAARAKAVTVPGQPIPGPRPAVEALGLYRDANRQYSEFREIDRFMQSSTSAQWFGGRIPDDPEKALVEIAGMEPAAQRLLAQTLRNSDPEALGHLRVGLLDQAYRAMINAPGRDAARGRVDPGLFAKQMINSRGETIASELFTPAQRAKVERALSTVRVLQNAPEGVVSISRSPEFQGSVMAIASANPAFLSRMMTRILALGRVEHLLHSEEGLRSLEVLRDVWTGGRKYSPNQIMRAMDVVAVNAGVTGEMQDPEFPDE